MPGVRDVPAEKFIDAYASHLKRYAACRWANERAGEWELCWSSAFVCGPQGRLAPSLLCWRRHLFAYNVAAAMHAAPSYSLLLARSPSPAGRRPRTKVLTTNVQGRQD